MDAVTGREKVGRRHRYSGHGFKKIGVQAEIEVRTIPKGTSVVAQEFSPGTPNPSAISDVRQFTIDSNRSTLDALSRELKEIKETREHARRLRMALEEEIKEGSVSIMTEGMKVIVHIKENTSFESGFAEVRTEFLPALTKIARLIDNNSGEVSISGHTDNVPIANDQFRSNWELSTSRAVSVAHEFMQLSEINPEKIIVTGHADTRPTAPNDTAENRAKNRRVEISILRGNEIDRFRSMSIASASSEPITTEELQP